MSVFKGSFINMPLISHLVGPVSYGSTMKESHPHFLIQNTENKYLPNVHIYQRSSFDYPGF